MPEEEIKAETNPSSDEGIPKPNMDAVDEIATDIETVFFEKSDKLQLSPYEMNMVLARVTLLFDEYKLMHFLHRVGQMEQPNVDFKGSHHIYK